MADTGLLPETIKEFVIAAHSDLDKTRAMLSASPSLLNAKHQWDENDYEDALGAASHVGNAPIARCLLERGAPMTICTAAMLGDSERVSQYLEDDVSQASAKGAHNIPIMSHAALSGNVEIARMLVDYGGGEGMSHALHMAIGKRHYEMVRWLLENGDIDFAMKNFMGKTHLQASIESDQGDIAALLREYGATN
jgi:ankyrin repeat protein